MLTQAEAYTYCAALRAAEEALRQLRESVIQQYGLVTDEPDDHPALQSDLPEPAHKQKAPAKGPAKNAGAPSDRLGF